MLIFKLGAEILVRSVCKNNNFLRGPIISFGTNKLSEFKTILPKFIC